MANNNIFNFTANFVPFKEGGKMQTLTVKPETGYKRLTMSLSDGKSNELVSLGKSVPKNGTIYVQLKDEATDKYKFTPIKYEDRFNAEIVDNVNPFKKFVLELDERKEFIFELDFIDAVYEAITSGKFTGKKLFVSGEVERKRYNGKNQRNFIPQTIKYAHDEAQLQLAGRQSFIFDKDSLDTSMMKTDFKFELNGWVEYYSNDHKKNLMFPQTFVFDFSKVKETTDETLKKQQLGVVEYMKDKFTVRKDGYYEFGCEVAYVNGTEEKPLELKDLSKDLQLQIELGITTLDQVRRDKKMICEKKQEIRLVRPDNKAYEEVLVRELLTEEDFIIRDVVEVKSVEEAVKKEVETPTVEVASDDLFASLLF